MSRIEKVELTVLCLIYKDNSILLQHRTKKDWAGSTLPGGHVEHGESFVDACKREMKEETGLIVSNLELCGIKQFQSAKDTRYIVVLYKTNTFSGVLRGSSEGEVEFVDRKDLSKFDLVPDFMDHLKVFDSPNLSEFMYLDTKDNQTKVILK